MSNTDILIKESFILMDTDSDGHLTESELVYALRFLGIPYDFSMSEGGPKLYSLDDFSKKAKQELGSLTPQEKFMSTIKQLDKNNDGMLSIELTTDLVFSMSDILSVEDVENFKHLIDPDNVGTIHVEEITKKIFG